MVSLVPVHEGVDNYTDMKTAKTKPEEFVCIFLSTVSQVLENKFQLFMNINQLRGVEISVAPQRSPMIQKVKKPLDPQEFSLPPNVK